MKCKELIKLTVLKIFSLFLHSKVDQIQVDELMKQIAMQNAPLIIDVRTKEEYIKGHIQGAINIPYDQISQEITSLFHLKEKEIIIYCRSGTRANIARKKLVSLGFLKLMTLDGHFILWKKLELPMTELVD